MLDRSVCRLPVEEVVRAAFASGVDWLQLRERTLDARPLHAIIAALREIARAENPDARIVVNRRIDIALAARADGVHLGFDALPPAEARKLLGHGTRVGVSTHSINEVAAAASAGADYVHLAPIFAPKSKPVTRPALGLDVLREACRHEVDVIAQGGVEARNAAEIIRAGAAGIAVTGEILMSDDPAGRTRALRRALDTSG